LTNQGDKKVIRTVFTSLEVKLMTEIEQVRNRMITLADLHGFLHPEVQDCSRQLDQLLFQFYTYAPYGSGR
jgi:hypothetical protein